ncbi:MAG: hypothetical protein K2Q20_00885 [Phycisphaerales bacterium]|nr:hypothetical protein [Phycisphaerales bacterium]
MVLPPDYFIQRSVAAVSGDGRVIVGAGGRFNPATFSVESRNFVFGPNLQQQLVVGVPAGASQVGVTSLNRFGSVGVGYAFLNDFSSRAIVWTRQTGTVFLQDFLAARGANLTGWNLQQANSISDDGSTIVGYGTLAGVNLDPTSGNPRPVGFVISGLTLGCQADFDLSGTRDVADIFAFLSAWFANAPGADFDASGTRDVADIFAFLSAWFAGCV